MAEREAVAPPSGWRATEMRMWRAFRDGVTCDLSGAGGRAGRPTGAAPRAAGPRDPETPDGPDDPDACDALAEGGAPWPAARTVRAQAVAELLLDPPPARTGRVGALKLRGARISGRLMLAGATIAPYVQLDDCRFDEDLMLPECTAGSMRLVRCLIPRLEAARLQITGDLHLPQCLVPGGIRLTDATIGTDLLINELVVRDGQRPRSVAADGLTVGQDVDAELIDVTGEFSLRSARIGGRLNLRGAALRNPGGSYALNAARISVEHTLYLTSGYLRGTGGPPPPRAGEAAPGQQPPRESRDFTCDGGVRLDDGRFGNAIVINRARFILHGGQQVSLRRVQTPDLRFTPRRPPAVPASEGGGGSVSLSGAKVGGLTDAPTSWPQGGTDLRGFTYDSIASRTDFPLARRIAWLHDATPEYSPEAYERLAAALRADGEDADAREVLLAKQRRRRESLTPAGRVWGWLQDVTVGYGYRPARAALWMAVLWAMGAVYFAVHRTPPPADDGYQPHWNPALYALDLLLPVIDLGQDNAWRETGTAQWVASVLTLLGWILATTAAAGASRMLRRGS